MSPSLAEHAPPIDALASAPGDCSQGAAAVPLISVLVPAFNAARFFAAAIESVLAQTFADFELILIDDGSTDDTLNIARRYAQRDGRIRVITHANRGIARSLNEAMAQARGKWIARLDADDVMQPDRLEKQLAFLGENPDLAVASSQVWYIDDAGNRIGKYTSPFTTRAEVAACVARHLPVGFHHPAAIFNKQIVQNLGGYRPQFVPAEDMDLWNRVIDAGHAVLVQKECLTSYRIHGSNVTVSRSRSIEHKAQWVEACILARHQGRPEPTEAELAAMRAAMPWHKRLNLRRRELGRALYKSAVVAFSRKRYGRFVPRLVAAASLEPLYVLRRVLPQIRRA